MNNNSKRDTLHKTELFEATSTLLELWKYRNFTYPVFLSFSQPLKTFLDCGASLSRRVRFDSCPTIVSVTVSFGQRHRWAMLVSTVLTLDRMDTNKLKISMRNMSFRNFNSGLQYDFSTHELKCSSYPSPSEFRPQTPSSVYSTPSEALAILCETCSWKIEFFSATAK